MALLRHIILSQTCCKPQNDSIEDSEVVHRLEEIDFAKHVKDAKSVNVANFLLPANSESDGMRSHKHDLAAAKIACFEPNFSRIGSTSETEASASGKAECLLAIGKGKK